MTRIVERIGQVSQWLDYHLLLRLGGYLPAWSTYALARLRADHRYRTRPDTRDSARRQMSDHLLGCSPAQIEQWSRDFFLSPCLDEQETYFLPRMTQRRLHRLVDFQGLEHLQACLDRGKGAIVFSGHTSSTCLFAVAHGLLGFPTSAIVRPPDPESNTLPPAIRSYAIRRQRWMERLMRGPFLSPGPRDLRNIIRRLQHNEVVLALLDVPQELSRKRIPVDFLGKKCMFPAGIARLAEETGCGLVPCHKYYHSQWSKFRMIWEKPLYASGDIRHDIQLCARHLETMIRQNPSQWYVWDNFPMLWAQNGTTASL